MSESPTGAPRRPIRLLDPTLINQIAAGEVIVRPASVVKELVENSLDAEATRVAILIDGDGRSITVTDDGVGIPEGEIETALLRHATSKITSFDEIGALETRGFRGEALASIASVARVRLTSRTADSEGGMVIEVLGGEVQSRGPIGAPQGTRVEVTDLFENVPARRKFLKSPQAEFNAILRVAIQQALSHPEVGLTLERVREGNRTRVLELPAEQTLRDRLAQVLGAQVAEHLVPIEREDGDLLVTGFIARPLATRRDTRGQHFFVGGRPVVSRRLGFALRQAMTGLIMTDRQPIAAIFIECPPGTVDVNVHPTKDEVRFEDEDLVAGLVYRAVQTALGTADLRPRLSVDGKPLPHSLPPGGPQPSPTMPLQWGAPQPAAPPAPAGVQSSIPLPPPRDAVSSVPTSSAPPPADTPLIDPLIDESLTIEPLGQIGDSYIVASCGDDMLVIDQHAAHERLMYALVQRRFGEQERAEQPLLVPLSFDLPASSMSHLEEMREVFGQIGIDLEPFGGQTVLIRSFPTDFERLDIAAVVMDVAADLEAEKAPPSAEQVRDRVLTRMACHAAIKANRHLSVEEMRALIRDIIRARLPHTCPHGRPTMALLTLEQLDKQFKRT
ncbi:DNA mismatch repair endonuclease MutL [Candidatus Sumerlaeota bacterium]|nr:DNA mismatch repair endonuclease MutL [Candidatus Sumerlaeota bacterium]